MIPEIIKIIHVDDDEQTLLNFKNLCSDIGNVVFVMSFNNAKEALNWLQSNKVDLVFSDIEMQPNDGFWLAQQIATLGIPFVFVTSHTDYMQKAFEACALQYLVKPFVTNDIMTVIERYRKFKTMFVNDQLPTKMEELMHNYINIQSYPKRVFINNNYKTSILNLNEVLYFSASGPYTNFFTTDGTKYVSSKLLKIYVDALQHHPDFVRIHRSNMVNKNFVKAVLRDKHRINVLMTNGDELEISPQKREEIYELLGR